MVTAEARLSGIDLLIRMATTGDRITRDDVQRLLIRAAESESDDHTRSIGMCRASRIRARDAALAQAAAQLAGDHSGPWQVACRLEQAVARFRARKWPRLRAGATGNDLDELDSAIYRAFLSGAKIPQSARQLVNILA